MVEPGFFDAQLFHELRRLVGGKRAQFLFQLGADRNDLHAAARGVVDQFRRARSGFPVVPELVVADVGADERRFVAKHPKRGDQLAGLGVLAVVFRDLAVGELSSEVL